MRYNSGVVGVPPARNALQPIFEAIYSMLRCYLDHRRSLRVQGCFLFCGSLRMRCETIEYSEE